MDEPVFKRVALIGIGLIGSSIARAVKAFEGLATEIIVNDSSQKSLDRVAQLGFADACEIDPAKAVTGADCVIGQTH